MNAKKLIGIFFILSLCAIGAAARAADEFIRPGESAPFISIRDQFGKTFELETRRPRPLVIIYAQKELTDECEALRKKLAFAFNKPSGPAANPAPRADFINSAMLTGIPPILRTSIKKIFKPVAAKAAPRFLLDWKGEIALLFGFRNGGLNAYIIDTGGIVRFAGPVSGADDEKNLADEVARLLRPPVKSSTPEYIDDKQPEEPGAQ